MRNLNKIFTEDVTYDNLKSHKKAGFTLSSEDTFLEKPQPFWNPPPPPPSLAVLGLKVCKFSIK